MQVFTGLLEQGLHLLVGILLEALRFIVYGILTLPLFLTDIVVDVVDIMSGVRDIPAGESIYEQSIGWGAPNIDYDGYLCIDLERLFIDEEVGHHKKFYERMYVTHESTIWAKDMHQYSQPFHGFGDHQFGRMENLWSWIPPRFIDYQRGNPRQMNPNFNSDFAAAAYTEDPFASRIICLKTGEYVSPVRYVIEGKAFYYIPGSSEEASKRGRFATPRDAVLAYLQTVIFYRPDEPFIWMPTDANIIDAERASFNNRIDGYTGRNMNQLRFTDLGAPTWLLSAGDVQSIRQRVRYRPNENMKRQYISIERSDRNLDDEWLRQLENAVYETDNRMNQLMFSRGYPDFEINKQVSGNNYANYKYWLSQHRHRGSGLRFIMHHYLSVQLFYSVKPFWNAYIDTHELYVADSARSISDINRYTEDVQEWMTANNIQPGSEDMYRRLSNLIYEGSRLSEDKPSEYTTLLNVFIGQRPIVYVFWGITLISAALCFGFTIFAVMRSMGDSNLKLPVGKVMQRFGKAMLTFLLTPAIVIVIINLSTLGLRQINMVLDSALAGTEATQPVTTGTAILTAAVTPESLKAHHAANEATTQNYRQRLMNGNIDWRDYGEFNEHFDTLRMYIVPTIAAGWFSLIMMTTILFLFMRRVFDVLLMYISAPFFVSAMPLDGGAKFKAWREMFISKVMMGFSSIITLKIALIFNQTLWAGGLRFSNNTLWDIIFKLIFMMGGFYAAYKSHTLISGLLNVGAAAAEKETAVFSKTMTSTVAGAVYRYSGLSTVAKAAKELTGGVVKEIAETDHKELTLGARNLIEKGADKAVNRVSKVFGKDYHVRFSQETSFTQRHEIKKSEKKIAFAKYHQRAAENVLGEKEFKKDLNEFREELKTLRKERIKKLLNETSEPEVEFYGDDEPKVELNSNKKPKVKIHDDNEQKVEFYDDDDIKNNKV
jgi:hypothetical protein